VRNQGLLVGLELFAAGHNILMANRSISSDIIIDITLSLLSMLK
jgi:hypothetical protein